MRKTIIREAFQLCKINDAELIHLVLDGSYVSGIDNPESDIDVVGFFAESGGKNDLLRINNQSIIDEYGRERSLDMKLYSISQLGVYIREQHFYSYRYFVNKNNVLYGSHQFVQQILSFNQPRKFIRSVYNTIVRELDELYNNTEKQCAKRYLYKLGRYMIQDIAALNCYIEFGRVPSFDYRTYLSADSSALFRLLVGKILTRYDYVLSQKEIRLLYRELVRIYYKAQLNVIDDKQIEEKEIDLFVQKWNNITK